jgi:anti-sigma-K factor RskA
VWNVTLHNRLDDATVALQSLPLRGASGSVVVGSGGKGVLVLTNLPAAPPGRTYEAWVIDEGAATRAGVFEGGRDVSVKLEKPVPRGAIVAVTVEREGGVDQPTRQPFVTSAPVV